MRFFIIITAALLFSAPLYSQSGEATKSRREERKERREERRQERENRTSESQNVTNEDTEVIPDALNTPSENHSASGNVAETEQPSQTSNPKEQAFPETKPTEPPAGNSEAANEVKQDDDSKSNWLLWVIGIGAALMALAFVKKHFRAVMGALAILSLALIVAHLSFNGFTYYPGIEWLCVAFVVFAGIWGFVGLWRTRCPHCKKLGAMKTYSRELTGERDSTITKTLKTKNRKGEVIFTREVDVPATVRTYRIHRRCKKCGHTDYLIRESKTAN